MDTAKDSHWTKDQQVPNKRNRGVVTSTYKPDISKNIFPKNFKWIALISLIGMWGYYKLI